MSDVNIHHLGDNCNYNIAENCYGAIPSDLRVLYEYLLVRDAYPTTALKNTRVLALSGMTIPAINMFSHFLANQTLSDHPIDIYFFSNMKNLQSVSNTEAVPLIQLSMYTYPEKILFGGGEITAEGFNSILEWMITYRHNGFFRNLKYFNIINQKISTNITDELKHSILNYLTTMCNDKIGFPLLEEFTFSSSYLDSHFSQSLLTVCLGKTGITIKAEVTKVSHPLFCSDSSVNMPYYDAIKTANLEMCRNTWNWEVDSPSNMYSQNGLYPNRNTTTCESVHTSLPVPYFNKPILPPPVEPPPLNNGK